MPANRPLHLDDMPARPSFDSARTEVSEFNAQKDVILSDPVVKLRYNKRSEKPPETGAILAKRETTVCLALHLMQILLYVGLTVVAFNHWENTTLDESVDADTLQLVLTLLISALSLVRL